MSKLEELTNIIKDVKSRLLTTVKNRKSRAAKLGWNRYKSHYTIANRRKERRY